MGFFLPVWLAPQMRKPVVLLQCADGLTAPDAPCGGSTPHLTARPTHD